MSVWNSFRLAVLLCGVWCGCGRSPDQRPSAERDDGRDRGAPALDAAASYEAASQALEAQRFDLVGPLVANVAEQDPQWQAAKLLAGEAATKLGRLDDALRHYEQSLRASTKTREGLIAAFAAAEIHLERCRLTEAERLYQLLVAGNPDDVLGHQRLAFLHAVTGRYWDALPHYFGLIQAAQASYQELALTADVERPLEEPEFLSECLAKQPEDLLVQVAVATSAFHAGDANAFELLSKLTDRMPELIAVQARLGELLVESGSSKEFSDWHRTLPEAADKSPDIWFVRGLWARKHARPKLAAQCFAQGVAISPLDRRSCYLLGQTMEAADLPGAAQVTEYSRDLIRLSQTTDKILISECRDPAAIEDAARILERLGRYWEACSWAIVARQRFSNANWAEELLRRHVDKLTPKLPYVVAEMRPSLAFRSTPAVVTVDFRSALDRAAAGPSVAQLGTESAAWQPSQIRFAEAEAGLDFVYFNSEDLATPGKRTFEQTGGGVGILDYDRDGDPDVFLSQGLEWPTGATRHVPSSKVQDGLFRNIGHEHFEDAPAALPTENGYGQGCAIGDVNNDGFADVYVANCFQNRLLVNNGDGTFTDSTESAGIDDESWTVSAMVCDLNLDGAPDLFDVNYLSGDDVFTRICQGQTCSPRVFDGAPDRVWLGRGDGTFAQAASATPEIDAKGLGVVAFYSGVGDPPTVFIANDQVANHVLAPEPMLAGESLRYREEGLFSGLAFNDMGLPMACMGVTLDDFDRNGWPDIFVTNFLDEPNTLYLQDGMGLFADRTLASGLYAPSLDKTGWGTQSLDADLDGWPDLVVVNGHVDDYRKSGGPYYMEPQFFRNDDRTFAPLAPDDVGEWFEKPQLGRGLARVDWNDDGRDEFIVSHVNAPVSVMTNETEATGHFLKIRLHATRSARDARGAFVEIRRGEEVERRQLPAGDGYMASNERVLTFGLGADPAIDAVVVSWPGGGTSTIEAPQSDCLYEVVEMSASGTRWRDGVLESVPVLAGAAVDASGPRDEGER